MITADLLRSELDLGRIEIEPYRPEAVNPNSYNLRIGNEYMKYETGRVLDTRVKPNYKVQPIPKEGLVLRQGELYLIPTLERTKTDHHIPCVSGRSSTGRLGVSVHVTAGFGDIGYNGVWTLELFCVRPVRIYAGDELAQIYFYTPVGMIADRYDGKYQGATQVIESRLSDEATSVDQPDNFGQGKQAC